jgi:acetyl-CoA synthetase
MSTPVTAAENQPAHERYAWKPSPEYVTDTNVARLMHRFGSGTTDELRSASTRDVAAFWDTVVDDLGITFRTPYTDVVDLSAGVPHARWFVGGRLNVTDACVGRWAAKTPRAAAVVHEDERGEVRTLSFQQLSQQVARVRAGLHAQGIRRGDAVALYLPMAPEAVVAFYAVASLGAVAVPLFSGFAASAIASRVQDAGAKAVITADATMRRGREIALLPQVRAAAADCPTLELVVVVPNLGTALTRPPQDAPHPQPQDGGVREVGWLDLLNAQPDLTHEDTASSDVLLLGYTSGTSGKPKGAVHTHAGFLVKVASEMAYGFDISPGRRLCWITDMGWIMGPLSILGTHACGGTLVLYEGSPDTPDKQRIWQLAERHRISTLGVSPSLVRALRVASDPSKVDLSTVRILGSTGEPWDPTSYEWLAREAFDDRVPIINFSGGTEVGGSFLCPYPNEEIGSCSLGGPALGMDVDVVDNDGQQLRGAVGELVCRQPWPAMTKGIWHDDERYLDTYWSTFPNMWRHGDHALVDDNGDWLIVGRSDDVINVAGKRVAPGEVEAVMVGDEAVAELAVVGVPDAEGAEQIWVFWTARDDHVRAGSDEEAATAERLRASVATRLGKPFAPKRAIRVDELPKTRSGKLMRRAIRAAALDTDAGDMSGAENPATLDAIRIRIHPPR